MTLQQYLFFVSSVVNKHIKVDKNKALEIFKKAKTNAGKDLLKKDFQDALAKIAVFWTQEQLMRLKNELLDLEKKEKKSSEEEKKIGWGDLIQTTEEDKPEVKVENIDDSQ